MALQQNHRIDRIEILFVDPISVQVRYVDEIIDDNTNEIIATSGYSRESYDITQDLSGAPAIVQAIATALQE